MECVSISNANTIVLIDVGAVIHYETSTDNKDIIRFHNKIAKINSELANLEYSMLLINQTCGTTDSRGIISVSRFLESIPVMQVRIEKLVQMKQTILANLNAILGLQMTVIEAQCE